MKTFSTLFSGFGLCDKGFEAAGLTPINQFEISAKLAEVGQANSSGKYVVADICEVDWHRYEAPDHLHASPVCTNASVANTNGSESDLDIATAKATMRAIETWKPQTVTMENVWGYRDFDAFKVVICGQLTRLGYQFDYWHLNSADFGVPQTRKRLILSARLNGPKPRRPEPTHAKEPVATLFGRLERWRGWYEAIEDLIPELPESAFAPWQLERLGSALREETFLQMSGNTSKAEFCGDGVLHLVEPANTVLANSDRGARAFITEPFMIPGDNASNNTILSPNQPAMTVGFVKRTGNAPRAFLIGDQKTTGENSIICLDAEKPAMTLRAGANGGAAPRAFLLHGTNANGLTINETESPAATVVASLGSKAAVPRAFLVNGSCMQSGRENTTVPSRDEEEPCLTVLAAQDRAMFRASLKNGRVVAMTPRALARFQSVPDSFQLSGHRKTDCTGIGNGFPTLMAQRVIESLREAS